MARARIMVVGWSTFDGLVRQQSRSSFLLQSLQLPTSLWEYVYRYFNMFILYQQIHTRHFYTLDPIWPCVTMQFSTHLTMFLLPPLLLLPQPIQPVTPIPSSLLKGTVA
jgi:hypothetical protein